VGGKLCISGSPNTIQEQLCGSFPPSFYEIVSEIIPIVSLGASEGWITFLWSKNTIPVKSTPAPSLCKYHCSNGFQQRVVSAVPECHQSTATEAVMVAHLPTQ